MGRDLSRESRLERRRVGTHDAGGGATEVASARGRDEMQIQRARQGHPHRRGEVFDPSGVGQARDVRAQGLILALELAGQRRRAANADAKLQHLDAHRNDSRK